MTILGLQRRHGAHVPQPTGELSETHAAAALIAIPALAWAAPPSTVTASKLSWGTSPTFAPFEFQRDGQSVGFDVDMMAELAGGSALQSSIAGHGLRRHHPGRPEHIGSMQPSAACTSRPRGRMLDFIAYLRIGDQMVCGRATRPDG